MAMDDLSKSILLQVAFKAATEKDFEDNTELMRKADEFYGVLVALHEKYEVYAGAAVQSRASSGGGNRTSNNASIEDDAPLVTIDGTVYKDLRGLKAIGAFDSPNYPDFKNVNDGKGEWLTKKDGSPTKFAQKVEMASV